MLNFAISDTVLILPNTFVPEADALSTMLRCPTTLLLLLGLEPGFCIFIPFYKLQSFLTWFLFGYLNSTLTSYFLLCLKFDAKMF